MTAVESPVAARAIRRVRLRLIPFLALLYLVAYLAYLMGFMRDVFGDFHAGLRVLAAAAVIGGLLVLRIGAPAVAVPATVRPAEEVS